MNDAVGRHGTSGMSQGLGHGLEPTFGTSVGVPEYQTPSRVQYDLGGRFRV